ncbi:MAG: sensor histidine kinase [Mycobacteriales bacterium]
MAPRSDWRHWALAGLTAGVGVVLVGFTVRLLLGLNWQPGALLLAGAVPLVLGAALGRVPRLASGGARALRESVVASGLAVFVCVVYTVVVVGFDRQVQPGERVLVGLFILAAIVVAVFGLPVRSRLREVAERLVPGPAIRPQQALDNLSARMTRAVPMDELLLQMAETLHRSMAPAGAEVWVSSDEALVRTASVPDRPPARLVLGADELNVVARAHVSGNAWASVWLPDVLSGRDDQVVRVAPISHLGELLGLLVVARPAGSRGFGEDDESSLSELARHTGLALHNVRLDGALQASLEELRRRNADLQASRARIVAAADASRRRIERDLHDGAQQHLVAMAVRIGLARSIVEDDPGQIDTVLEDFRRDIQATLTELRGLAHGIYPPLLRDRGLGEALRNAGGRSSLPVEVDVDVPGRLPPDIEAAVYFCCLEAMNNAGKHAGEDAKITVNVACRGGSVVFDVADDGVGYDVEKVSEGQGFLNMRDRVGAYGGEISVESAPGKGARVIGRVPVPAEAQNPPT